MADNFLGEIRAFPYNFEPKGWAACDGQILSISQNTALFSLLGTQYGGDGKSTFALPNLQGRIAVGQGDGFGLTPYVVGDVLGSSSIALLQTEMPSHRHALNVSDTVGDSNVPSGHVFAKPMVTGRLQPLYSPTQHDTTLAPDADGVAGGSQPHNNMQPVLGLQYMIALTGIFPSRN